MPATDVDEEPLQTICVMDFNVHPKRVDDPCGVRSPSTTILQPDESTTKTWRAGDPTQSRRNVSTYEVITESTVVPRGVTFAEDVVTRLPYSASTRKFSTDYTGFMIDDERLIGMKVRVLLLF